MKTINTPLVTSGQEWTFELIDEVYDHIADIAKQKYGMEEKRNIYPNQLEIISSEQMLDAYCITLDHKLLLNNLTWVQAKDIKKGDKVLGFDEHGPHRQFREAIISNIKFEKQPIFKVTLSSGKTFRVTKEHKWLIREKCGTTSRLKWVSTLQLRTPGGKFNPSCIPRVLDIWDEDQSKDAGWLAGIFDGEGNIVRDTIQSVNVSQNKGIILERIKRILDEKQISFSLSAKPSTASCYNIRILGNCTDKIRFLGSIRPERLISKLKLNKFGLMKTPHYEEVVSIESAGIDTIAKIATSTGTFICDGYPMHNCSNGLPIYYSHWTFGEQFIRELESYRRGRMGLAYEIVINSNPCIAYLMEENTMLMQTLVTAHASFGHNYFFKNNYLYKQWTDASTIIDYLSFAKKYIADCEEKYGVDEVESVLDAAHSLKYHGVDKYKRPSRLSPLQEEQLQKERESYIQSQLNELWNTIPRKKAVKHKEDEKFPRDPQENLLYFIEKNAPRLDDWKREIVRIVRKTSQYFYPQMQTQLMNEGCATYFHYKIMHDLHENGIVDDGAMLEFYQSHTNVVFQPDYDSRYYSGINPYALGFAMYKDIERVAMNPTQEDREWFGKQEWVGSGDYLSAIKNAIANFKDESFVQQYLSPTIIREFRMFNLNDNEQDPKFLISGIHNQQGYKIIRDALSKQYNIGYLLPDIQVQEVDRWGDRTMTLRHKMVNDRPLETESATDTLKNVAFLWGYNVRLESYSQKGTIHATYEVHGEETILDVFLDDGDSTDDTDNGIP